MPLEYAQKSFLSLFLLAAGQLLIFISLSHLIKPFFIALYSLVCLCVSDFFFRLFIYWDQLTVSPFAMHHRLNGYNCDKSLESERFLFAGIVDVECLAPCAKCLEKESSMCEVNKNTTRSNNRLAQKECENSR